MRCQTVEEALEMLIEESVEPYVHQYVYWQDFRSIHLWNLEVNDIFFENTESLKKLLKGYIDPPDKFISKSKLIQMFIRDAKIEISESTLLYNLGMCKMTVTLE